MAKLKLIKNDPWLEPYAAAIEGRHEDAVRKEAELLGNDKDATLSGFANGHNYFGLHRLDDGKWVFREWAPNATAITLVGDFSDWKELRRYELKPLKDGVWEVRLPKTALRHGQLYDGLAARVSAFQPTPPAWYRIP